jgi:hypothetical protein
VTGCVFLIRCISPTANSKFSTETYLINPVILTHRGFTTSEKLLNVLIEISASLCCHNSAFMKIYDGFFFFRILVPPNKILDKVTFAPDAPPSQDPAVQRSLLVERMRYVVATLFLSCILF